MSDPSEDVPITEEYLEQLLAEAPSGRILGAYNKKKQEGDPEMPCIVFDEDEPCPCWKSDDLSGIGSSLDWSNLTCTGDSSYTRVLTERTDAGEMIRASAYFGSAGYCQYHVNILDASGEWYTYTTYLSTYTNTLSLDQAGACLEQINAHYACSTAP